MRMMGILILFSSLMPVVSIAQRELAPASGGASATNSRPVITVESYLRSHQQICQNLADKYPDLKSLLDLTLTRESEDLPISQQLAKCSEGASGNLKEIFQTLVVTPASALTKIGPGLSNSAAATKRYLDDCNLSLECKTRLFEEAHGYSPSGSRLENLRKQLSYTEMDVLHRSAQARMNTTFEQNRRQQRALEARRLLQNPNQTPSAGMADNQDSLWMSIRAGVNKKGDTWKCLKADVRTEYICYYAATAGLSLGAVGLAAKFPRAAQLLRVSSSADDVVAQAGAVRRPASGLAGPPSAPPPPPTNSTATAINANASAAGETRPTFPRGPQSDALASNVRISSSRIPDRMIQGQPARESVATNAANQRLGSMTYSYDRESGHLVIDSVRVENGARLNGVNQQLLQNAVRENPNVKSIGARYLTETNEQVVRKALDAGASCEDAIRGTPAYRTRANLGFSVIRNASCGYRRTPAGEITGVNVHFDAFRP